MNPRGLGGSVLCRSQTAGLAEGFGYQDGGAITGEYTTTERRVSVRLRLDQLL
jgi:hypothetical protein